ncbi:MAG: hypothetical protein AUJ49_04530 [Desulfovibrionaceae bacterium CG1_02_65_16]|nr:MAG: hypothetical protein AUJ49_04530 [Desulfovibrionaceae bacterium CG1_02_65_16]
MAQRILAADIGGTSSRFGFFILESGMSEPRLEHVVRLPTAQSDSFAGLLVRVFAEPRPFAAAACDLAVLAVPGAVENGFCSAPNIKWSIDLRDIGCVGLRHGALINDFSAQAYGCRSSAARGALVLQPGAERSGGPDGPDELAGPPASLGRAGQSAVMAVIGAGTGLGHCALVPDGAGGSLAVPSEAGHAAFPFVGEEENAYGEYVRRVARLPFCHGDAIVTGSGLARLHAFLTGEELSPAEVTARLADSPRTVEWFARFYGRAARNYALTVLAVGGVLLSGGVAARTPALVQHPAFLAEFCNSVAYSGLLAGTPVSLNRNEDLGVFGAAAYGAQRLRKRG